MLKTVEFAGEKLTTGWKVTTHDKDEEEAEITSQCLAGEGKETLFNMISLDERLVEIIEGLDTMDIVAVTHATLNFSIEKYDSGYVATSGAAKTALKDSDSLANYLTINETLSNELLDGEVGATATCTLTITKAA